MSSTLSTLSTIGEVITLEGHEKAPPAIDRASVATECQPERSDQYVEHFHDLTSDGIFSTHYLLLVYEVGFARSLIPCC